MTDIAGINYDGAESKNFVANSIYSALDADIFEVEDLGLPILNITAKRLFMTPKLVRNLQSNYNFLIFPCHSRLSGVNPNWFDSIDIIPIVHDLYMKDREPENRLEALMIWLMDINLRKCQKSIAVSKNTKKRLVSEDYFSEENVMVVEPPVKDVFYPENKTPESVDLPENYILNVGTFVPRKRNEFLLEVLEELPEDYHLVKIGDPTYDRYYEDFEGGINSRGLSHRVKMLDWVSEQDLRRIYSSAQVYLHSARRGGMELPPLEAASCGTPVFMQSQDVPAASVLGEKANKFQDYESKKVAEMILESEGQSINYERTNLDDVSERIKAFLRG